MTRLLVFLYGVLCYTLFLATFVYAIGFIGNIAVPKSIDSAPHASLGLSLVIDFALLMLFAVQHSGMARPAFKCWLTRFIPPAAERSTFVLLSSACVAFLMWQWAPLGGVIWHVTATFAEYLLTALFFASCGLLLYATCLKDHFDRYGLRHALNALRGLPSPTRRFRTPALYRIVRHPVYAGWLGIVWFTPTMTITHLVFAIVTSLYILIGLKLEERDLEAMYPEYAQYKRKVPALLPSLRRRLVRNTEINAT